MLYSVLFRFGHIRRSDQCAVYILYSKVSTDPGLPKIRHSHRFVAVVIQFFIPLDFHITRNAFCFPHKILQNFVGKTKCIVGYMKVADCANSE